MGVKLKLNFDPQFNGEFGKCNTYVGTDKETNQKECFLRVNNEFVIFRDSGILYVSSETYHESKEWILNNYKNIRPLLTDESVTFTGKA